MSHPDDDIRQEIHTLLSAYMKDKEADKILSALTEIMRDPDNNHKLVRLFQKWGASA